jgi:peptidase C39-like protein
MFKTQNLYQNDEKWKNVKLGNSSETIGSWGCLLTSATMMLNGIGYNETPETVNEKMQRAGGFQQALFIPSVLPYIWPNSAYRDMQPCESLPAPLAQIDAAVAAGKPVILQVDWNKQAGIQTHYVLVKERIGVDYAIYDPYKYRGDGPNKEVLFTSRYKYNGGRLEKEISAVLWFDSYGTLPADAPKLVKVPLPAEKYILYAGEDDLALRAEPSLSGFLWKRLLSGTQLICLEPRAAAKAKLGMNGQWINVQDPAGDQGYVAAWYVNDASGLTTPGQIPSTSGAVAHSHNGGPLKVRSTAEAVALRRQPVVSDATLIKWLPLGTELLVLEPNAEAKIGRNDQWLSVKDPHGDQGYVAAWFVAR